MDEDLEGMQSTIYLLQQQLKDAKEEIARLQTENQQLQSSQSHMTTQSPLQTSRPSSRPGSTEPGDRHSEVISRTANSTPVEDGSHNSSGNVAPNSTTTCSDALVSCKEQKRTSPSPPPPAKKHEQAGRQTPNMDSACRENGNNGTANGEHMAMETDTSDGLPTGCEENKGSEQNREAKQTLGNAAPEGTHRPSHTSEGTSMLTQYDTDMSSDGWSPNRSKTTGVLTDDMENKGPHYRTDTKASTDLLQNGLVVSRQYDSPEET